MCAPCEHRARAVRQLTDRLTVPLCSGEADDCAARWPNTGAPPAPPARATPLSEYQEVLLPQLLEPCRTWPFINRPPCQSDGNEIDDEDVAVLCFKMYAAAMSDQREPAVPLRRWGVRRLHILVPVWQEVVGEGDHSVQAHNGRRPWDNRCRFRQLLGFWCCSRKGGGGFS